MASTSAGYSMKMGGFGAHVEKEEGKKLKRKAGSRKSWCLERVVWLVFWLVFWFVIGKKKKVWLVIRSMMIYHYLDFSFMKRGVTFFFATQNK